MEHHPRDAVDIGVEAAKNGFDPDIHSSPDIPHTNGNVKHNAHWIPMAEYVLRKPQRKLKVISIGCGFSGLAMAHKIQNTFKLGDIIEHVLYEKNPTVGGTWFENRYPGVMCDVPAHIYTLLDLPNPDWPSFYATGGEIQEYLTKITKQYNLDRNVVLNSKIIEAVWNENEAKWHVKVQQEGGVIEDTCDILINGSGILNAWSWPDIPDLHTFQGILKHSADWQAWKDPKEYAGKRVAVIGNGSSGIQILPEVAKVASLCTNIIRGGTWISAPFAEDLSKSPGTNPKYTEEEKEEFRRNPEKLKKYRHDLAHAFNHFYEALVKGSEANIEARRRTKKLMEERLSARPELCDLLIPKWDLGCRRLTPGNGYLESLTQPNVDVFYGQIDKVTATGICMSDGKERDFDMIICATGFDVSFKPRWSQLGLQGRRLADEWHDDPQAYFSVCVSGYPNFFIFNGPGAPVGHGSLSSAIDWTADYILKWIRKIAHEDIKTLNVKKQVQDEWNLYGDEILARTVWADDCRSWYKNGRTDGRISALYPGSILHFKDMLEDIRGEDFEITYFSKNQWKFLGNGFTQREVEGGDLGYYMKC